MKKFLIFVLICLNINYFCLAQPEGNLNKIETLHAAYITRELGLTTEEAQKFWPVFNNYRLELKKARQENSNELEWEEKALGIRKKYKAEFRKVLNDEQRANRFFKAERGFRDMLRKEQVRRQGGGKMKPNRRFQK